jgi:hypothetical protein
MVMLNNNNKKKSNDDDDKRRRTTKGEGGQRIDLATERATQRPQPVVAPMDKFLTAPHTINSTNMHLQFILYRLFSLHKKQ